MKLLQIRDYRSLILTHPPEVVSKKVCLLLPLVSMKEIILSASILIE